MKRPSPSRGSTARRRAFAHGIGRGGRGCRPQHARCAQQACGGDGPQRGRRVLATRLRIGERPRLEITAISITPHDSAAVGDHIARAVHDERSGARLFVAPALGRLGALEAAWMEGADCAFIGSPDARPAAHWAQDLAGDGMEIEP